MLRTLLFAALLGVVTANNDTTTGNPPSASVSTTQGSGSDTPSTTAPDTNPPITKEFIYSGGKVKVTSSTYGTASNCTSNAACVNGIAAYIKAAMQWTNNGTYSPTSVQSVTIIALTAGSIVADYSAQFAASPGTVLTAAQLNLAFADSTVQAAGGALGTAGYVANSATAATSATSSTQTQQATSGICTATRYTDANCLTAATSDQTTTIAVTDPASVSTSSSVGGSCSQFPGLASSAFQVRSYFTGSTFSYKLAAGTTCAQVPTNYVDNGILDLTCIAAPTVPGTNGWVRVSCTSSTPAATTAAPTSNAIGAGLSAVTAVVAFLMM